MAEERAWLIEAVLIVKDDPENLVEELRSKGFEIRKRELIYDLD